MPDHISITSRPSTRPFGTASCSSSGRRAPSLCGDRRRLGRGGLCQPGHLALRPGRADVGSRAVFRYRSGPLRAQRTRRAQAADHGTSRRRGLGNLLVDEILWRAPPASPAPWPGVACPDEELGTPLRREMRGRRCGRRFRIGRSEHGAPDSTPGAGRASASVRGPPQLVRATVGGDNARPNWLGPEEQDAPGPVDGSRRCVPITELMRMSPQGHAGTTSGS